MTNAKPRALREIAITGVGVLTPFADNVAGLSAALNAGACCVADTSDAEHPSARLADFDPKRYANIRGMRVYARNTQLQICVTQLALNAAGLTLDAIAKEELGLISASTHGHLETLIQYDQSLVSAGVDRTNPTLMPLALPSAAGALTALAFGAKAFALTLSNGGGSGLDALSLGARFVAARRAEVAVVTSAFTHCAELTRSASAAGELAPRAGFRVFDRESCGTAFGELAIAFVLEPVERAEARKQPVLGRLFGHAATYESEPASLARGLTRAATQACAEAGVRSEDISVACAGANGQLSRDGAEAHALRAFLGARAAEVPLMAPKAGLGEALDASGLIQTLVTLEALRSERAAPIAGLREPAVEGLGYLSTCGAVAAGRGLITSLAPSGACSALVVSVAP